MRTEYLDKLSYRLDPFSGARLKIKRAKEHLRELEVAAQELPRKRSYHFVISPNAVAGRLTIIFLPDNLMPLEFAGILGDVIHNIRSALDHTVVAISCSPFGKCDPRKAMLPSGQTLKDFETALSEKLKRASPEALRLVRDLEPYEGGKFLTWEIHQLDIFDKHKLLIPSVSHMSVEKMEATVRGEPRTIGRTDFQVNEDGSNLTATIDCPDAAPDDLKINRAFHASFTLNFGPDQPLGGRPTVSTLRELLHTAAEFVEKCSQRFGLG